jgi:hypothetical protein
MTALLLEPIRRSTSGNARQLMRRKHD